MIRLIRQRRFDRSYLIRSEQLRRCAKVDDGWLERPRPFDDEVHSRRKKERRNPRRRHYRSRNLRRPKERLFARKLAVADQNPNVVDTNLRNAARLIRAGDLIDLGQHGAIPNPADRAANAEFSRFAGLETYLRLQF
jgi:hypothetical protein